MARTAEGDPKEREILRVLGRQIEEPVDSIDQAAVQDFAIVDPLFPLKAEKNKVPGKDK